MLVTHVNYRFSIGFVIRWLATALLSRRRAIARDAERELARYRPAPQAIDDHLVPARGPFIAVINHYERPGLRMWWSVLFVSLVLARRGAPPTRWMMTDRFHGYRVLGVPVPDALISGLLRLVARTYGLLLVSREEIAPRAPMLRRAFRVLHSDGECVGIAPEAGNAEGLTGALVPAMPGSGAVLAWLSHGEIPILPIGVWDDERGRLTARVGQPFTLERPRGSDRDLEALTDEIMHAVAVLLPAELRGAYSARA